MILDQWENALRYLGISPELDIALRFLSSLTPGQLAVGSRVELQGTDVFYTVSEPTLSARPMTFEFHRRYADIHVPVTGEERIALCPASSRPADTPFDSEKDIGFFPAAPSTRSGFPPGGFAHASRRMRTCPASATRRNTPSSSWYSRSGRPEPRRPVGRYI